MSNETTRTPPIIVKDLENGGAYQVVHGQNVHASFSYTIGDSRSRNTAKLQAEAWREGYLYAAITVDRVPNA